MQDTPTSEMPQAREPLSRPIADCVQMIYPTPIAIHVWPDSAALNDELARMVLEEERRSTGLARSNVGGWHSPPDFLHRRLAPQMRLLDRIHTMIGELSRTMQMKPEKGRMHIEGWANVLRRGQYNSIHVHPNSTWSGVYYVTGNPPPAEGEATGYSGKIEFVDPRPGAAATYTVENALQTRSLLDPGPGTMIAFPSWLQHLVHPYFGPGERISIAFNVLLT